MIRDYDEDAEAIVASGRRLNRDCLVAGQQCRARLYHHPDTKDILLVLVGPVIDIAVPKVAHATTVPLARVEH